MEVSFGLTVVGEEAEYLPDLKALFDEFAPRQAECPVVVVEMPSAALYDTLLDEQVPA